ncbi:MAG: secretin N-terminal domain-containing protein, partial [bacterium]
GGLVMGSKGSLTTVNSISLDKSSNSIIYVGEEKIYERFYNLVQGLDVAERATVIRTIPLKYILVRDLAKVEPINTILVSSGGGLAAGGESSEKLLLSEPTNSVTYIGNESGYERTLGIIRSLDIADRQYVTKIIQLKYVNALELANSDLLMKIGSLPGFGIRGIGSKETTAKSSTGETEVTNITTDLQTNSVIISSQKQYMDQLVELISSLDVSIFKQYQLETMNLKYINCARAWQIIGNMMETASSSGGGGGGGGETFPYGEFFAGVKTTAKENYNDSKGLYPQSYKWVVVPDASKNELQVLARPQEMEMIKKIVEKIDRPYPQLKLDVQIVELDESNGQTYKLGYVTKDGKISQGGNVPGVESPDDCENPFGCPDVNGITGMFFAYDTLQNAVAPFSGSLQSIVQKINGRIVANPSMIAPENTSVYFDFSDVHTYVSSKTTTTTGENVSTSKASEGYTLTITSHFKDDYVVLMIDVSSNEIKGYDGNIPIEGKRNIRTEVKIKDGEPVILGGMVKYVEKLTSSAMPLVSRLPFIGSLFRSKDKNVSQSETVFVITPTILYVK